MIGALISYISLDVTKRLIAAGVVASTFTIVSATNTTPVVVTTSAEHGLTRPAHGIVSSVGGNAGANGLWVCTPASATTLTLTTYDAQGAVVNSAGTGAYTSGGQLKTAFPDGSILLGRRNVAMQMAVATPRIVFVPLGSPEWGLDPYGGVIPTGTIPAKLSAQTAEQKTMKRSRQLATERQRFEVHVTGCATPPSPDFGDFDVTQGLYQTLFASLFDLITPPRAKVLKGDWVSQSLDVGQLDVRGQKWVGIVEISQPVIDNALDFVPSGTFGVLTVQLEHATTPDKTVITLPPVTP